MSGLRWLDVPFQYTTNEDFQRKLTAWLGDVFYDLLPAQGYEVREEQIYTAFRMAEALCSKETLLAEAGSGTGKTFAYLLPAVCYARHVGRPVILSSASSLLQEQLVSKAGDISELSRILGLNIDARVAKDPRNYLCQRKAERTPWMDGETAEMRRFREWQMETELGDRGEVPEISDEVWQTVAWDESLACDNCERRGYCQVAKNRLHVWAAKDFVVCSHDQFFDHLWNKAKRDDEGLPPLLPQSAAIIFDEGHLLERPAIMQLGHGLREQAFQDIYQKTWAHRKLLRGKLMLILDYLQTDAARFFRAVLAATIPSEGLQRWFVQVDEPLISEARAWLPRLREAADQLSIETEQFLWTPLEGELRAAEQHVEQAESALRQLCQPTSESVVWWEPSSETLWVLPGGFGARIGQELTKERQALIFTSATLQASGSFAGMKQLLGLPEAKQSIVATPFQLAQQMAAYLPARVLPDFTARAEHCRQLLIANHGRALVLLQNASELNEWRQFLQEQPLPFPVLWEEDGERNWLIEQFRKQTDSVLIGTSFWEGVDVPGDTLSLVVVFSLPFPEPDPLLASKRVAAQLGGLDAWETVDLTEMVIKLRQGYGRLIRTTRDRGILALLDLGEEGQHRQLIAQALPDGVPVFDEFTAAWQAIQTKQPAE